MARRKNMQRRREILGNTFSLIRENGMANVSLQMIAEKTNISKSLLQSYYPHKAKLISDIVRNLFTTLSKQVDSYDQIKDYSPFSHMKAFVYTICSLGIEDEGLDRIIQQAFSNNETLDNWGLMLFQWIHDLHFFDGVNATKEELESGISFVTIGVGRLYYNRDKYQLTAEDLANYATSSLMYSFCHCSHKEVERALDDGHKIIKSAEILNVSKAIDSMFDEGKEIIS